MYGYETFHEELMKNLIESVHQGRSSHAYIFEGEKGLGKLNSARLFAASLTCSNTDISPCGTCSSCVEAKANSNPDIIYVRPKKDKKTIGADDMRELEEDVAIKPFDSKHKVYIFEDGAQLTPAAQNVFLKTFEEPPEYAVFIIVIENLTLLLPTILSRFTSIHFPPVSNEMIERHIRNNYPEIDDRLPFLIKFSGGIPGTADKIIKDEEFEPLRMASLENLFTLCSSNKIAAFKIQKFLEENKEKAESILNFWLLFLRDVILIQTDAPEMIINVDKKEHLRKLASRINPEYAVKMTNKLVKSENMLGRYVSLKAISMWLALDETAKIV